MPEAAVLPDEVRRRQHEHAHRQELLRPRELLAELDRARDHHEVADRRRRQRRPRQRAAEVELGQDDHEPREQQHAVVVRGGHHEIRDAEDEQQVGRDRRGDDAGVRVALRANEQQRHGDRGDVQHHGDDAGRRQRAAETGHARRDGDRREQQRDPDAKRAVASQHERAAVQRNAAGAIGFGIGLERRGRNAERDAREREVRVCSDESAPTVRLDAPVVHLRQPDDLHGRLLALRPRLATGVLLSGDVRLSYDAPA